MVQYSVKKSRGRKIKKYRKSRRGKGRGKRSLKGGKTRRYKVFKNTKNHTLGKRKGRGRGRRMMGGLLLLKPYDVNTITRLKDYINDKYRDKIIEYLKEKFHNISYIMVAKVMITDIIKPSFFRKDYKLERIIVYGCYTGFGPAGVCDCYALVRVPGEGYLFPSLETSTIPIDDMDPNILFIIPNISECNATDIHINYESWKALTFKSFISSDGDKYKIIPNDYNADELLELLSPPSPPP